MGCLEIETQPSTIEKAIRTFICLDHVNISFSPMWQQWNDHLYYYIVLEHVFLQEKMSLNPIRAILLDFCIKTRLKSPAVATLDKKAQLFFNGRLFQII